MSTKTKTLLDVAKLAHLGGNRNAHTDDGEHLNVEGFRNGWVTVFRGFWGIGPDFIHPDIAADMVVTDLGQRK